MSNEEKVKIHEERFQLIEEKIKEHEAVIKELRNEQCRLLKKAYKEKIYA